MGYMISNSQISNTDDCATKRGREHQSPTHNPNPSFLPFSPTIHPSTNGYRSHRSDSKSRGYRTSSTHEANNAIAN